MRRTATSWRRARPFVLLVVGGRRFHAAAVHLSLLAVATLALGLTVSCDGKRAAAVSAETPLHEAASEAGPQGCDFISGRRRIACNAAPMA
jgi:hypothetical protein